MTSENIELTDEQREAFRRAGRKGGLTFAAQNDVPAHMAQMRATQAAGWLYGHGCAVCGPRIDIPIELDRKERDRRAKALKKRHYSLLAMRRHGRI